MARKKAAKRAKKTKKRYVANLKSIRVAIDKVIREIEKAERHAGLQLGKRRSAAAAAAFTSAAPGYQQSKDRAAKLLETLRGTRSVVAGECCQEDQNCPFDF